MHLLLAFKNISCKNKKKEIIATINTNEKIYLEDIDNIIDNELYSFLLRVNFARKKALDELLFNKLIEKESKITSKNRKEIEFLNIDSKIDSNSILDYIIKNQLQNGIPDVSDHLRYVNSNSIRGVEIIKNTIRGELKRTYFEILKNKYDVKINLPELPLKKIKLEKIQAQYYGNLNSNVTVLVISNIECEKCKNNDKILKKIFAKYSKKIKIGYSNFSDGITLSSLAFEAAALQNKFWELHDLIMESDEIPNEKTITEYAIKLKLDITKFYSDLKDNTIKKKIDDNNEYIISKGIYGTPNVIINGFIVNDPYSSESIEKTINEFLNND